MFFIHHFLVCLSVVMITLTAHPSSPSKPIQETLDEASPSSGYFRIMGDQKIPMFDEKGKLIDKRIQPQSDTSLTLSLDEKCPFLCEIPQLVKEHILLFLMDHPEAQLNLMRASRAFRRLAMPLQGLAELTVPNFIRCRLLTVMIAGQSGNFHDLMTYHASGFEVLPPALLRHHILERTFNSILNLKTLKAQKYCTYERWQLWSPHAHFAHDERLLIPGPLMNLKPNRSFAGIESIDVQNNLLFTFPVLTGFTSLINLYLNRNQFTIPPLLTGLVSLKVLYLSDNMLKHPPILTTLTNLRFLHMTHNVLEVFPDIQGLQKLEEIYVSHNHLSNLDNLPLSPSIKTFCLDHNLFTEFPPLTRLQNLGGISFEGNKLTDFPELRRLDQITYIDLSDNALVHPPVVTNLKSLGHLRLSRNALTSWPTLLGLSHLCSLDIDENPIRVPLHTQGIQNVQSLKINGIPLTMTPELQYLRELNSLWIDERQLNLPGLIDNLRLLRESQRQQDHQLASLMILYDHDTNRYKEFDHY